MTSASSFTTMRWCPATCWSSHKHFVFEDPCVLFLMMACFTASPVCCIKCQEPKVVRALSARNREVSAFASTWSAASKCVQRADLHSVQW
eukprot:5586538-Amphidinium_carterae.1